MGEPLILALDGSTDACSAALLSPGAASEGGAKWQVLAAGGETDGRSQARTLLQLVDNMVREVGGGPEDLAAIVAGTGPGTFTGVRITVATARALALALHVPVLGISTLAALAAEAVMSEEAVTSEAIVSSGDDADIVVPVIDARRGQVFYSVYRRAAYRADGAGLWERSEDQGVCDREALPGLLHSLGQADQTDGRVGRLLVPGEAKVLPVGVEGEIQGLRLWPVPVRAEWRLRGQECLAEPGFLPAGARLGPYLMAVLRGPGDERASGTTEAPAPGEVGSPESVRPIYVRAPDADVHITKMRDPWAAGR
jgi:tRNA threonylcarbamoyl adenosine modification protein YeaZ